jgi:hypothetical protein
MSSGLRFARCAARSWLAAVLAALPPASAGPATGQDPATAVAAQFRGCAADGWCRFDVAAPVGLVRVRPLGVCRPPGGAAAAVAQRDRLNALLSDMIHQHKRIALHDLRELGEGGYQASVTVNGQPLAQDPALAAPCAGRDR